MDREIIENSEFNDGIQQGLKDAIERLDEVFCKDCDCWRGIRCRACLIDDAMAAIESLIKEETYA